MSTEYKTLFLCKDTSSRSLMAQALLNQKGRGRFKAFSACVNPANPAGQEVFAELASSGLSAKGLAGTSLTAFLASRDAPEIDFVIVPCDKSEREICPKEMKHSITAQWDIPDPAAVGETEEVKRRVHEAFVLIDRRINLLLALQDSELRRMADEQKTKLSSVA